jgi:hypothetical protein
MGCDGMNASGFRRLLAVLAMSACARDLKATDAETPETATAKVVVAILGPKEGIPSGKYDKIQVAAQDIITSLLPDAKKKAIQQMKLDSDAGLSIKLNAVPYSLVFELYATGPSLNTAADYANDVAGQLEQGLPKADPAAVQQLELQMGMAPILLILETAKPSFITEVRH